MQSQNFQYNESSYFLFLSMNLYFRKRKFNLNLHVDLPINPNSEKGDNRY